MYSLTIFYRSFLLDLTKAKAKVLRVIGDGVGMEVARGFALVDTKKLVNLSKLSGQVKFHKQFLL